MQVPPHTLTTLLVLILRNRKLWRWRRNQWQEVRNKFRVYLPNVLEVKMVNSHSHTLKERRINLGTDGVESLIEGTSDIDAMTLYI